MMIRISERARMALDIVVSSFLVVLGVYLFLKEPTQELPREALGMIAMFYLGLLFGCAYVARERLYVLRVLSLISEYLSYPQRRQMALVYSLLFFAVSAYYAVRLLNAG